MKKILVLMMAFVLVASLAACNNNEMVSGNTTESDMTSNENDSTENSNEDTKDSDNTQVDEESTLALEEIINLMYENADIELPAMGVSDLTEENMAFMLGVDNFEFIEGVVSEPMMGSFAHSVVLLTVEETADIETIKSDIKNNVDGRKWICVGVEPENILVENVGSHIILIMSEDSQVLSEQFMEIMNQE